MPLQQSNQVEIVENVMLVDDDPVTLEITTLQLQSAGFDVTGCSNAEDALQLLESGQLLRYPTVVLTDIQMPGLWGNELARRVRAVCAETELGAQTMVVAMSGTPPRSAIAQAFDGFILKPFTSDEVQCTLRKARGAFVQSRIDYQGSVRANTVISNPNEAGQSHSGKGRVLDRAVYDKLARVMSSETLHELYSVCIRDCRKRINKMEQLLNLNDMNAFREVAHSIKGGCGMVGAEQLAEIARGLELDGYSPNEGHERLSKLSAAANSLESILQEVPEHQS